MQPGETPAPEIALAQHTLLVPRPRRVAEVGPLRPVQALQIEVAGARERDRPLLMERLRAATAAPIELDLSRATDGAADTESYRLVIVAGRAEISASGPAGAFYGVGTLAQILRLSERDGGLADVTIEDRPSFAHRGLMLDVSRDRVPTQAELLKLVDRMADWKLNQLQLYTEHTFAYAGHETVWQDASPLTPDEIRALDACCAARHIALVPNQQSFGHFHRWLVHDAYRDLAIVPEGIEHPFSPEPEPFSLDPTNPAALELLEGLYDQLLPCFTSRQLNVGCDETIDLGQGRTEAICAERGAGRVYLDYLRAIHGRLAARGCRMQLWGDIVLEHPELVPELPKDVIALIWGYEADHDFSERGAAFTQAGVEWWVCPGTSAWNAFAPRTENAVENLARAAIDGATSGANGYLMTDWGDFGHLQPPTSSLPGQLAGAAAAWNASGAPSRAELPALLDAHALHTPGLGQLLCDLGDAHCLSGATPRNVTALFLLVLFPERPLTHARLAGLTEAGLHATRDRIGALRARLPSEGSTAATEIAWVGDMLSFACELGLARFRAGADAAIETIESAARQPLLATLESLLERHRRMWRATSRSGGLRESHRRLDPLVTALSQATCVDSSR